MTESSLILTPDLYERKLTEYFNPPTSVSGNLTLRQFFDLMYYLLNAQKPGLVFSPAWPQYLIPDTPENKKTMENPTVLYKDTITYIVTREEPGSQGGDKRPFGGRQEITPRIREIKQIDQTKSRQVYGQWFDTLVQFDLWALTNFEVDALALWFKRFMTVHRNYFKHMGLSEIHFWWRGRDEVASSLKNKLHVRSMVYFVRTEELSYVDEFNLQKLQFDFTTNMKKEE